MSRTVSDTFKQAIYAQDTNEIFATLIEITDGSTTYRFCDNNQNMNSGGNNYVALPFMISLPNDLDNSVQRTRIIMDNVNQTIIQWIRGLKEPPSVTIKIVLVSSPNTVEALFTNFSIKNIIYDALTITGELAITSFYSEPFPGDSFTPYNSPGIF